MSARPILIAGGGPVGIITALALAQRGLAVRLFEAADSVNEAPRASTLHPATLEMIAALGMFDDVVGGAHHSIRNGSSREVESCACAAPSARAI